MSDVGLDEVLDWFFRVSEIPRTSGNEKTISDTLRDHYERKGLDVLQDEAWNLLIRKPAHAGQGDRPGLILQAHLDMVGEKTSESCHDFATDPIQIVRDGDVLHAQDTVLGADDGIGVAICLALLDSEDVHHPDLEILLTTQEETGLVGAKALTGVSLRGQYFLNIDGEREGVFLCSGAGGSTVEVSFPLAEASHTDNVWELRVRDLRGATQAWILTRGGSTALLPSPSFSSKSRTSESLSSMHRESSTRSIARCISSSLPSVTFRLPMKSGGSRSPPPNPTHRQASHEWGLRHANPHRGLAGSSSSWHRLIRAYVRCPLPWSESSRRRPT